MAKVGAQDDIALRRTGDRFEESQVLFEQCFSFVILKLKTLKMETNKVI